MTLSNVLEVNVKKVFISLFQADMQSVTNDASQAAMPHREAEIINRTIAPHYQQNSAGLCVQWERPSAFQGDEFQYSTENFAKIVGGNAQLSSCLQDAFGWKEEQQSSLVCQPVLPAT